MTIFGLTGNHYLRALLCTLAIAVIPACGSSSHAPADGGTDRGADLGTDRGADRGNILDTGHVACSGACPAGKYQTAACTATADRMCASCAAIDNCDVEACTTGTDQTCTTCATGFYVKDGACAPCSSSCSAGHYQTAACSATDDITCASCAPLANCAATQCTTASDSTCSQCDSTYFQSGGTCHQCSGACPAGQQQSAACTATTDRACTGCTVIVNCTTETCTNTSDQTCQSCAGGYQLSGSNTQCTACASGSFSVGGSATSCTPCAAGTYAPSAGATACLACPAGTSSGPGASACTPCAAGSYAAVTGSPSCTACPAGNYATTPGATNCSSFMSCGAGQYVSSPGSAAADRTCAACATGQFSTTTNAVSCTAWNTCNAGQYVSAAGTATADRTCAACATGQFSTTTNAATCAAWATCNAGQYIAVAGSATADRTCAACATGQFSTTTNAATCAAWTTCNAGQHVSAAGTATADRTCAACATGQFSTTTNAASCAAWATCNAGQYIAGAGSATTDRTCTTCATGQFSTATNATTCAAWTTCSAGQYVSGAGTATADRTCAACATGQFSATTNAASCAAWTTCSAGQYVSGAGTATADRTCAACATGQFSATANAASCAAWTTCSAGQYVSTAGSATADRACTACATGTFSTGANAGSCGSCATCGGSQYQVSDCSVTANRVCASCDATCATCSGAGPSSCTTCPVGATFTGGSCALRSDCYAILTAGLSTGDGLYTVLAGSTPVQVFCDMTNGGYTLLNDQDIAQGFLPSDTWRAGVSTTAPNGGQWGILNLASSFQNDGGGFEFRMTFGQSQADYLHWYQTGDASTGARGSLSGVTMTPANQIGCGTFNGLADDSQGESAWDANAGGCWWFAVGSSGGFGPPGGIPAYEVSDAGQLITDRVRLWVRKNGPAYLAAWYPLDEGGGTGFKDISNGNNGSLSAGAWATGAACHSGACLAINGGYAAVPNTQTISFGTRAFTATAWVKSTGNGAEEVVMGNNECFVAEGWLLSMSNGRPAFATFGAGSSNGYIQSPAAANDGQWHFLAGVRTSTSVALYVDGTPVASAPISASYSSDSANAELQIGNLNTCARGFNGSVDDLRLYAGALTPSEITALMQTQTCAARLGCGGATPNCTVTVGSPVYGQMVGTLPTADHNGIPGGALSFSTSDNVTFTNSSIPIGGAARSMSFWMKSSQSGTACMVNYGIFATAQRFGVLIVSGLEYFVGENSDNIGVNPIDDGNWHHVLVTYDGSTVTLYRDGALETSASLGLNTGSSDVFVGMAVAGHSPEFYAGQLDDLRFYDRALSSSEAALVYSGDVTMKTTTAGLASWYPFNGDGSEETARCGP